MANGVTRLSVSEASELAAAGTDRMNQSVPEVKRVFGQGGSCRPLLPIRAPLDHVRDHIQFKARHQLVLSGIDA